MSENKKNIVSPCISVCQYDHEEVCMGCFRSTDERLIWKDTQTSNEWKEHNLAEIKQRMPEMHYKSWLKTYEKKKERVLRREKS